MQMPEPEFEGYGIVRGPDGKPKIADIGELAPEHIAALTKTERADLGLPDTNQNGEN